MAEEELSISTAVKRRTVIIDGEKYELMNQDELKLDAGVRLSVVLDAFRNRARLTEEGALTLSKNLVKAVRDVLPGLPKEIQDKLSDEHMLNIVVSFFKATPAPAATTASESLPVKS